MEMVIGGAFQGKTDFVCSHFGIDKSELTDGSVCGFEEALRGRFITSYHKLIARLIEQDIDPIGFTERLCAENRDAVIILDEIGCGIIPIERSERKRREDTGRCGCIIAEASDEVIRVACGIPMHIKGGRT